MALAATGATPALGAIGDVTDFTSKIPTDSFVHSLAAAPDGSIWVGETSTSPGSQTASRTRSAAVRKRSHGSSAPYARIGRLAPNGTMRLTSAGQPAYSTPTGVAWVGGALWASISRGGSQTSVAVRLAPTGEVEQTIALPAAHTEGIAEGPDGKPWAYLYNAPDGVARVDPGAGTATPIPGSPASLHVTNTGTPAVLGRGLFMYVTTAVQDSIATISASGVVGSIGTGAGSNPMAAATGPDGSLWWTPNGAQSGTVVRQAAAGAAGQPIVMPAGTTGYGLVVAPDGAAWVLTEDTKIVRVTPGGGASSFTTPVVGRAAVIGADGNVWVAQYPRGLFRVLSGVTPANTAPPLLSGRVEAGQTLTAGNGEWKYMPSSYAYTWQQCASTDPNSCANVAGSGAAGSSYVVPGSALLRGAGMRVLVTATNANGTSAAAASNIVTADSPPSNRIVLGKSIRRGYVISTKVTVPGPGDIQQFGTVPGTARATENARRKKPKPVTACKPKLARMQAPGTRVITCSLSKKVRAMLATRGVTVTLSTTFVPSGGTRATVTRKVKVPKIAPKR